MPTAHHLGGHRVLSKWLSVPMEHMQGTAVRNGPDPGLLPRRWLVPMEVLWGMEVPNGPGTPAGRTRSRA